jgi:hypothetical protein
VAIYLQIPVVISQNIVESTIYESDDHDKNYVLLLSQTESQSADVTKKSRDSLIQNKLNQTLTASI